MSGTSLDGVDIALVRFDLQGEEYSFEIIKADTFAYSEEMQVRLLNCRSLSNDLLIELHNDWACFVGELINLEFLQQGFQIDLIASHGHTVFHQPKAGLTLQIGSLEQLLALTNVPTVGDFRALDVAKGGEGAPLVPIGDRLLFKSHGACLNLGGIANISFEEAGERVAFDVAPCNLLLNYLAKKVGKPYDEDGQLAFEGAVNKKLLSQLNSINLYLQKDRPSLGIEYIEEHFYPLLDQSSLPIEQIMRTCVVHIAIKIAKSVPSSERVLLSGGGAFNKCLIKEIQQQGVAVELPSSSIINFKEALIFAFLGLRRVENKINVLKSVTGANSNSCAGQYFEADVQG